MTSLFNRCYNYQASSTRRHLRLIELKVNEYFNIRILFILVLPQPKFETIPVKNVFVAWKAWLLCMCPWSIYMVGIRLLTICNQADTPGPFTLLPRGCSGQIIWVRKKYLFRAYRQLLYLNVPCWTNHFCMISLFNPSLWSSNSPQNTFHQNIPQNCLRRPFYLVYLLQVPQGATTTKSIDWFPGIIGIWEFVPRYRGHSPPILTSVIYYCFIDSLFVFPYVVLVSASILDCTVGSIWFVFILEHLHP